MSLPKSAEIAAEVKATAAAYSTPEAAERRRVVEESQLNEELAMLDTALRQDEIASIIRPGLANFSAANLRSQLDREFYNPAVLEAMLQLTHAIVYTPTMAAGALAPSQRVREWIRGLKRMGSESVSGYAMKGNLGAAAANAAAAVPEVENAFILKAPRDPSNRGLIHEIFVAQFGTNHLRQFIPSFSYVLGFINCSSPYISSETKEVKTWCTTQAESDPTKPVTPWDQSVYYVIYENITNAVSMSDYVTGDEKTTKASGRAFLNMYLQALLALKVAKDKIGFTHYDCHAQNVLLRDIGSDGFALKFPVSLKRTIDGATTNMLYYVTDRVVMFIDYGTSRIEYNGKSYGAFGLEHVFVDPERAHPLHDAYKLLLNTGYFASLRVPEKNIVPNTEVLEMVDRIYRYFNPTEPLTYVEQAQSQTYFSLPETIAGRPIDESFTLEGLINHILDNCGGAEFISDTPPAGQRVLHCSEIACSTTETILNETGVLQPPVPTDFVSFYDAYYLIKQSGSQQTAFAGAVMTEEGAARAEALKTGFNYVNAKQRYIAEIHQLLSEAKAAEGRQCGAASTYQAQCFTAFAELADLVFQLDMLIQIGGQVAKLYNDSDLIVMIEAWIAGDYSRYRQLVTNVRREILSLIETGFYQDKNLRLTAESAVRATAYFPMR